MISGTRFSQPVSVSRNGTTIATFIYDGDGNRIARKEAGETVFSINGYYEQNMATGNATSNHYLGGKLIATSENGTIRYIHTDHLGSTSLMTDVNGDQIDTTVIYEAYGEVLEGDVPTDRLFTGQRLDETGLYFYNARYYDALIGRFISPDKTVPNYSVPQAYNRYAYCLNNPLVYVDPSGYFTLGWSLSFSFTFFGTRFGFGFSSIADDHNGLQRFVFGCAGASVGTGDGVSASVTAGLEYTNANRVSDLGPEQRSGFEGYVGQGGYYESIIGSDYSGWSMGYGLGAGLDAYTEWVEGKPINLDDVAFTIGTPPDKTTDIVSKELQTNTTSSSDPYWYMQLIDQVHQQEQWKTNNETLSKALSGVDIGIYSTYLSLNW